MTIKDQRYIKGLIRDDIAKRVDELNESVREILDHLSDIDGKLDEYIKDNINGDADSEYN